MTHGRKTAVLILAACVAAIVLSDHALAQSSLGIGAAEPAMKTNGLFGSTMSWINSQQQAFYRSISTALKSMRDDPGRLWVLVGLSFAYGIFHAAGPGHGKAVISSYLIANEQALRRGVLISFLAAFAQGFVAIAVVGATYFVLRGSGISMTKATWWLEIASYALITGFGAWLLYRKLWPQAAGHGHDHSHQHDDRHHHDHEIGVDGVCSTCGHSHAPDPVQLQSDDFDWRSAWSAVIAIGLRPCSGALIVLTFALLNGLYLGGLLSVTAMSIGTAITVSILATLAVTAKGVAVHFASTETAAMRVTHVIEIAGAALVLVLGLTLLMASLQA